MQVVVWIIIIMVIIFLIWLLRRWIKRLIFIMILLALAFLIYGIFNPSGAARLWYNVRTFPQRMASWMGSTKEFLDYDNYKSKISSIGDEIGDTVDGIGDTVDSIGDKIDLGGDSEIGDLDFDDELDTSIKSYDNDEDTVERVENSDNSKNQAIKSFPKSVRFVEIPQLKDKNEYEDKSVDVGPLTGYSKSDLIGVINKYIEKNLDDNTDILVTVEYEDDSSDPQKIILQTKSKMEHSSLDSGNLVDELFGETHGTDENRVISSDEPKSEEKQVIKTETYSNKKTTSTRLTQQDQKDAEEIFSILF